MSPVASLLAAIPVWDWHWQWWVDHSTWQLWFDGLSSGMVFGLLAMGIVLIYRSTKVINLAVGNMGLPAMSLLALMVVNYDFPYWVALFVALFVGLAGGAVIERVVIRRLFDSPRVIVLVATVGVAQLMTAIMFAMPDPAPGFGEGYPVPLGAGWEPFWGIRMSGPQVTILVVAPILAIGLALFLNRTVFGQTVQASATNPDLARLQGIDPKTVSLFVWTVAGGLAAVSMIMLAGDRGQATGLENLGATTMTRALAAAVLAGMYSFPRAIVAGLALGVLQAHITFIHLDQIGLFDLILLVTVLIAVVLQTRTSEVERSSFAFVSKRRPIPEHLRSIWWIRHFTHFGALALLAVGIIVPLLVDLPSRHFIYTTILAFAVCAVSVSVITGWAGQVSLAQMAFAGFGAFLAAGLNRGLEVGVGWGSRHLFDVALPALPYVVSMLVASLLAGGVAAVAGIGTLRVRGLLLAVTTFVFALAAQAWFFRRPVLSDRSSGGVSFRRGSFLWWDLGSNRAFYFFSLGVLVVVLVVVARLRRSGIGRSIIAVRDNENTASAYAVSPTRMKLLAFSVSGAVAGLGGALLGGLVENVPLANRFFTLDDSLRIVSMAVIGGLGTLLGPVIGALWVQGLPAFWPENELVPLFTSSVGLLVLILYFPAGLAHIGYATRDNLVEWAGRRHPAPPSTRETAPPVALLEHTTWDEVGEVALRTKDVVVRFGGILGVAGVDFEAHHAEIVGLIGTNGAGKSTLMNAIGGFVPAEGRFELNGTDITDLPPHARARHGLGRTFQAAELFPELTVRETVLVALEARQRTNFLSTALYLPASLRRDRVKRRQAAELIDFLGLGRFADTFVSELSTGTRRIVELAGLLALDAHVLCLDEPTAGLAQRETEAFGPLILSIQRELGATMIVIEHDMSLIMSLSDRVYCLEEGLIIAVGPPEEVRHDPAVIASYLGTDTRAIGRSNA